MYYTFNATDKGYIGKAFEMAVKDALKRKNANRVSPCGSADFRFHNKNYDTKQNGTVLKYSEFQGYVRGSNRVIYATHVAYDVIEQTADTITISVNLAETDMFVLDKQDFVNFLFSIGCIKYNLERATVNVQTVYNYKKNAYHGKKGKVIEAWASENDLSDDIIGEILAGL